MNARGLDLVLDLRYVGMANLHHTIMLADALRAGGELGVISTRFGETHYEADSDCLFEHSRLDLLDDESVKGLTR